MKTSKRIDTHPFFSRSVTVCAHRGDSKGYPENTLPAFMSAADMGVDLIETDIHLTKDGVCVVSHDKTIDRTTEGSGRICDFSLAELKRFDAGYRFSHDGGNTYPFRAQEIAIPTLEELLRALPHMRFNIDLKTPRREMVTSFIETIQHNGAVERVLGASFHSRVLKLLRKQMPEMATSFSKGEAMVLLMRRFTSCLTIGPLPPGLSLQAPEYYGRFKVVTPALLGDLHELGIRLQVWTINGAYDMERLLDMGVDGIMTDDPTLLLHVQKKRKSR